MDITNLTFLDTYQALFGKAPIILAYFLLYLWVFWLLFVAAMNIYRQYLLGNLTLLQKILGAPVLIVGGGLDIVSQYTIATVLFRDVPPLKEYTVSKRFTRYIKTEPAESWRYKIAKYICTQALDTFDPNGKHCTGD